MSAHATYRVGVTVKSPEYETNGAILKFEFRFEECLFETVGRFMDRCMVYGVDEPMDKPGNAPVFPRRRHRYPPGRILFIEYTKYGDDK